MNADNVKAYGLFVEHTLGDLTQWNGDNGEVYFYQSELPYDVTQQNYGDKGYAGFYISDSAKSFHGYGIAVYSYFRDYDVWVNSGIKSSSKHTLNLENSYTRFLNGKGGIRHVVNDQGSQIGGGSYDSYLCAFNAYYEDFLPEWRKEEILADEYADYHNGMEE